MPLFVKLVQLKRLFQFVVLGLLVLSASAEDEPTQDWLALVETLSKSPAWQSLQVQVVALEQAPIPGFFAVYLSSGQIFYIDKSGKYLFGELLIELEGLEAVHHTRELKRKWRQTTFEEAGLETVNFPPPEGTDHVAWVFTDVSCGYCRQLHDEMEGYHDNGIEIRYIFWARRGMESQAHEDMVSAWCAKDPQGALTRLKQGKRIKANTCEHELAKNYDVVAQLGLSGTPAILLENGTLIGGYVDPDQLLNQIITSSN